MSSPPITKVAIAGASGAIGAPITTALLKAGFTVTALTRPDSTSTFPTGVQVSKVDYTSASSLESALTGQDALISTLTTQALGAQSTLMEAAAAAGVKRLVPSEFGSDTLNPRTRALPVFKDKVAIQDLVQRLCAESDGTTTYTLVLNSVFLDWGVEKGFLIDAKTKSFELIDGGERYFTTTPLSFIAAGVVAILRKPDETANRAIRLQGARMTQKRFLALVQRVVGSEGWTVTRAESKGMEEDAYAGLEADPANVVGWVFPMIKLSIFAEGFGGDFGGREDNALLGLKELSEDEVEEVIRGVV